MEAVGVKFRMSLVGILAAVAGGLLASCSTSLGSKVRDWRTYRDLTAHERRFADISVQAYQLEVSLFAETPRADVRARLLVRNGGNTALDRTTWVLTTKARLTDVGLGAVPAASKGRTRTLGDLVFQEVEVRHDQIASGDERWFTFHYTIAGDEWDESVRIDADDGYLLWDGLWVPTLHTLLAPAGPDRAPVDLTVDLPEAWAPLSADVFEVVDSTESGRIRRRMRTDFRYGPFLVYGSFRRAAGAQDGDGRRVSVWAHESPAAIPPFADHIAARALATGVVFEGLFGAVRRPPLSIVPIDREGGSWGSPTCILVDPATLAAGADGIDALHALFAHEISHTWWGYHVTPRGLVGYVHEGLAEYCAALALEFASGHAAKREFERDLLARYAAGGAATKPLGRIRLSDGDLYRRGAYAKGALFFMALEEELGRAEFLRGLHAFAGKYGSTSADLDDLRGVLEAVGGRSLHRTWRTWIETLENDNELIAAGRAVIDERRAYWQSRDARPDTSRIEEARLVIGSAITHLRDGGPDTVGGVSVPQGMQLTVIDTDGRYLYHAAGLVGGSHGFRDVHGRPAYAPIISSTTPEGTVACYDFQSGDRARLSTFVFARGERGEIVIVEIHRWERREPATHDAP